MIENDIYDGFCAPSGFERDHVFDCAFNSDPAPVNAYLICRCGEYRRRRCECSVCGDDHWKTIPTDPSERLQHEIFKLNLRLAVLEGGPYTETEKATDEATQ